MKYLLFTLTLFFSFHSFGWSQSNKQIFTLENFEKEVLAYSPVKTENLTQKELNFGTMVLEETKKATKQTPSNFNNADYFNILSAFLTLKESPENVVIAFQKFSASEGSCEYLMAFEKDVMNNDKYIPLRKKWIANQLNCEKSGNYKKEVIDIDKYSKKFNLQKDLVILINQIDISDKKYRAEGSSGWEEKQQLEDSKNQQKIDSLFKIYGKYIGKSLVGDKFESVMWAVIQHSNEQMMEKYLPFVHDTYLDNELNVTPLKMLIDRFYGLKYGYQVFGSQSGFGFELADEQTRKEIEKKYGIE